MKLLLIGGSIGVFLTSLALKPEPVITVIVSGNARGQLSPCGCTKPMSGGLLRLAQVVRETKLQGKTVWIDTGNVVEAGTRQDQLKFETYCQAISTAGVDLISIKNDTQQLGKSAEIAAQNLLGFQKILNDSVQISGLKITSGNSIQISAKDSLQITQTDGTGAIQGKTVSPGSRLRSIVIARFRGGRLLGAKLVPLSASISQDPKASKIYRQYLRRVTDEKLVDRVFKTDTEEFVGSEKCGSCHSKELAIHKSSLHHKALRTLETVGHSQDPDCLSCHVVGLNSNQGFVNNKTPQFEEVGCESCHGPGKNHSVDSSVKMGRIGEKSCVSCHTSTTSPSFTFSKYWKHVSH